MRYTQYHPTPIPSLTGRDSEIFNNRLRQTEAEMQTPEGQEKGRKERGRLLQIVDSVLKKNKK